MVAFDPIALVWNGLVHVVGRNPDENEEIKGHEEPKEEEKVLQMSVVEVLEGQGV